MSVTKSLKKQVDLPVWEWCRFAPVVSSVGLTLCSDESDGGRYIYYIGTACYRYDTWSDGWQIIATPNLALTALGASRYTVYGGYRGDVISATTSTITLAGLQGQKLLNKTIRITSGKGMGQERIISSITDGTIWEHGIATTASASVITDNQTIPKKWKINQWQGYQVRLVFGTGQSQVRKILYNDTNTLTVTDTNYQAYDSWNNTGFAATAPYALPVNAVSFYYIESSVATVNTPWTTIPDSTSRYAIMSGAVWFLTQKTLALGAAAMQYYDILTDTWITKTCPGGVFTVLATSDVSIERTGEIGGTFYSGYTTSGDTRFIVDSGANWTYDRYCNYQVRVTDPTTEVTQRRRIIGNNTTTMFVEKPWDTIPVTGSTYKIYGDTNSIWVAGNSQSSLYKYMIEEDMWTSGQNYDSGVVMNLCYGKIGKMAYHATTVVNTAAMLAVNPVPTAAGTGYKVGDILNVTQGTGGKVRVTSIVSTTGAVTGIELYACGTAGTYTTGTGKATSNAIPAAGGGSSCTIEITSVGSAAYATTAMAHQFKAGDVVYSSGATVAAWNSGWTILACDSLTTFYFIPPNTTAPVASNSNSTSLIVDASKNWTVDEHKGRVVILTTVGVVPTGQIRKILSNTATTLTVSGMTSQGTVGTSRYVISDLNFFGRDEQYKMYGQSGDGWATSGTSSSLTDTGKTWLPGQWINYKLKVICGTGYDKGEITISDNTSNTLTLTTPGFTPDTTTKYRIMYSYGIATGSFAATTLADSTKNWAVNQWAGKSIRVTVNAAQAPVEVIIASNTATVLTYATTTTVSDTNTLYTILGEPIRNTGIQVMWNYGSTRTIDRGKWLYTPRGGTAVAAGTNLMDRYDITQDVWDYSIFMNPASEIATLGAQWSYDGKDKIYWTPSGAQGSRIFALDINTFTVDPASIHPYANGVAVQGNRMEIITTEDGLKYLYVMRVTGAEMFRTLVWWND